MERFDAAEPKGDQGGNTEKVTGNAQPSVCDDAQYCPFGPPAYVLGQQRIALAGARLANLLNQAFDPQ